MERFIFDIDGTLINADFELESKMLRSLFSSEEEADKFVPLKVDIIEEYEDLFNRYNIEAFRNFISLRTGLNISREFINEWLRFGSCLDDKVIDGVGDTLEYLKSKDKELVILSNWFTEVQIERLRKNHLLEYFSEIYGGDYDLKPHLNAYLRAFGKRRPEECIMIGDNYLKDFCGALNAGARALHYNPNGIITDKKMIKRIDEIKERF